MTTKDYTTAIDKARADIYALETYIIPEYEQELAHLTSPEYEPEDNPNPQDREEDIDRLMGELLSYEGNLNTLNKQLKKLLQKGIRKQLGKEDAPY